MASGPPSILSISYDESLLRTREWLLRSVGFSVTSALGFTEAAKHCRNSGFDLVVIGHSIPRNDRLALIEQIKTHNHTRILSLRRQGEEPISGVHHSVESSEGPDVLIAAVKAALREKPGADE